MTTNDTMLGNILRSKCRQPEFKTSIWSNVQPIMFERKDDREFILKIEEMLRTNEYELGWQLKQYFLKRNTNPSSEVRAIECELRNQLYDD